MATLAQSTQPTRPPAKEKKIFRSISKFLSGGKSRSKLAQLDQHQQPTSTQNPPLAAAAAPDPLASSNGHDTNTIGGRSEGESASLAESGLSVGADTAASVRALPPRSAAPSVLTRSTSAAGSVANSLGGTYKSEVSTKPTTVMSVDSGAGANRIAVVHGTGHSFPTSAIPPSSSAGSIANQQGSSSTPASPNGITFSALPPSIPTLAPTSPPPESYPDADGDDTSHSHNHDDTGLSLSAANVPRHTRADPRNNPHPAYPPPDNASMLTLASSSFAPSFSLPRPAHPASGPSGSVAGSGAWSGGGLTGLRAWRDRDGASSVGGGTIDRADEDASVRALVGSRRASEESLGAKSTWSAAVLLGSVGGGSGRAASVLTKGTTGTGGEEDETEAQKVVRHEGDRNLANDQEALTQALAAAGQPVEHAAPVEVAGPEAEHDLTPTEEKDVAEVLPTQAGTAAGPTPVLESTAIVPEEAVATSLPVNADAEVDAVPHPVGGVSSAAVSDSEDDGVKTPQGTGLSARDRTQSFASGYETATEDGEGKAAEGRREELA